MVAHTRLRSAVVLAVHGGAGTIARARMTRPRERQYLAALERALLIGHRILVRGGSSVDAVRASVMSLEDCPLFNAGRGAVFHSGGGHELDAAVMDGATLRAGGVTCVRHVKNPVALACDIMRETRHVMLAAAGAEDYARERRIPVVTPDYFSTRERLLSLRVVQQRQRGELASVASAAEKHGTVGAVARDSCGHLAAATSTGGLTNKRPGRVGDSPIIGAGTYADDRWCAVSATGDGEVFMRRVVAYDVLARMRYAGLSLAKAARAALAEVGALAGEGGLIAVDRRGRVTMPYTSEGMYRGYVRANGRPVAAIY